MVGPRGLLAFLLFCLPLIHQAQPQPKVFILNGATSYDGVYEEDGRGSNLRYKRMGGADEKGWYRYLYRGTHRPDTWVVGYAGRSFEARVGKYRAPAGGGGYRLPPEEDWQNV